MSKLLSSIDLIHAFSAVMAKGSLSAAARHLQRSQPTVRRQIETLEAEVGTTLFTRSGNGLLPTAHAVSLLPLAESIVAGSHAFVRSATISDDGINGTVRMTCSQVFATYLMPEIVTKLTSDHTGLTIEVVAEDRVENLLRRDADIAVRLVQPDQNAIVSRKVSPKKLGLFVSPDFCVDASRPYKIADYLMTIPFVWEDRDDLLAQGMRQFGWPCPSHIAVKTDDQVAQIAYIRAGAGAGICQIEIAERLGLRRIAPDWTYLLPVWIAMHEDQSKIPIIRALFDALVAAFTSGRRHKHW